MTITFTPITNIKEVEVEGYGKVRIRPYGAGEELQISKNFRELQELQMQAEDFAKLIKDKYDGDESKVTNKEKAQFDRIMKESVRLSEELDNIMKSTITSDEDGVVDRLFAELPKQEISRLIATALRKEADAEA